VRNSSLLGHELLCLHLRSFYGIEPCSPAPKTSPVRRRTKEACKKSRFTRSLRLPNWR
jgi:hypothetical protein